MYPDQSTTLLLPLCDGVGVYLWEGVGVPAASLAKCSYEETPILHADGKIPVTSTHLVASGQGRSRMLLEYKAILE